MPTPCLESTTTKPQLTDSKQILTLQQKQKQKHHHDIRKWALYGGSRTMLWSWLRHQHAEWFRIGMAISGPLFSERWKRKMATWWVDGKEEWIRKSPRPSTTKELSANVFEMYVMFPHNTIQEVHFPSMRSLFSSYYLHKACHVTPCWISNIIYLSFNFSQKSCQIDTIPLLHTTESSLCQP